MMLNTQEIIKKFGIANSIILAEVAVGDYPAYQVSPAQINQLLTFLKSSEELRFTILTDLFAADFPERDERFEVIYSLLSLKLNERIILKTSASQDTQIYTITNIFSAACWYEREVFDMFGINFVGAQDLRRILTDYGFVGHPLRKDFPLTGYLQVKYDQQLEQVVYEPVKLDQEYRNFDFSSPWFGPSGSGAIGILPGDEKAKIGQGSK